MTHWCFIVLRHGARNAGVSVLFHLFRAVLELVVIALLVIAVVPHLRRAARG